MLLAKNISKSFSGIKALDHVSIELQAGKVCAIIGENGAGKSTLMKILSGVYTDFEGEIFIDNQRVSFQNTKDAQTAGIAIIHQELNLIPYLSIRENVFLGNEKLNRFGLLDKTSMKVITNDLLKKLRLNIDSETLISELKVGQQQLVEIAKALLLDAKIIIMDEPSSAISGAEVDILFEIIEQLKAEGKAIAYISHKLDEVYRIAENYTVLRDGKLIESDELNNISRDELVAKMVGRDLRMTNYELRIINDEVLLEIKGVNKSDSSLITHNLSLNKGQILGIFGLMGAGRTELLEAIFGLRKSDFEVWIEGKKVTINSPIDAIKHGLAMVSEDRKKDGFIPDLSVKKNVSLTTLTDLLKFGILNENKENQLAQKYIKDLSIKTSSPEQTITNLSGGNQQKVILSKWLATNPKILILDEPTRGIDVNAKAEIYKIIRELAQKGLGIIMVSSELPEILAISDRILVMNEGRITGDVLRENANEEILLKYAISFSDE
jgi:ribose transport system ATP-binding protein